MAPTTLHKVEAVAPDLPAYPPDPPSHLEPATSNPWYVLATIFGEQCGDDFDSNLHEKNRRIWNGWACTGLSDDERARLAERLRINIDELREWDRDEKKKVEQIFAAIDLPIPSPDSDITFYGNFSNHLNLSGFIFIGKANFGGSYFSKPMIFESAIFCSDISFESSIVSGLKLTSTIIEGKINFENAQFFFEFFIKNVDFRQTVRFNYTRFLGRMWVVEATFASDLAFYKTYFSEGAATTGTSNVIFEACEFSGQVSFVSIFFLSTIFRKSRFGRSAYIGYENHADIIIPTQFHKGFSMKDCTFEEDVRFEETIFGKGSHFGRVFVKGAASFRRAEFREMADFSNCDFEKDAHFDEAIFAQVRLNRTRFRGFSYFGRTEFKEQADFSECEFFSPTIFRGAKFSKLFPKLSGAMMHAITLFAVHDDLWPKGVEAPAEESRESLAIIRHAVGKQGLPEEEHYFFRREMAFAARIGGPLQRLPYQLFRLLSNFGHSLARPTLWLSGFWLAGLLAYTYWLTCLAPTLADAHPIFTAAGFSFSQLFGFLGFTGSYFGAEFLDALPTALKAFAGLQTVAGVVLLFFLGLGLRNRFRLK